MLQKFDFYISILFMMNLKSIIQSLVFKSSFYTLNYFQHCLEVKSKINDSVAMFSLRRRLRFVLFGNV